MCFVSLCLVSEIIQDLAGLFCFANPHIKNASGGLVEV